jgi:DNA-binding MarR family transcriptional regulator
LVQANRDEVRELAEAVTALVEGAYRGMARTFDITRIGLLRLAASGEPLRPSDVADALDVNPSTVTRYVRALEDEGHVRVTGDPADRRSCLISVTTEGRAELTRFAEAGVDVFATVVHDWNAEDIRQFTRLINQLAGAWMERGPVHTRPPRRAASPHWKTATGGSDR